MLPTLNGLFCLKNANTLQTSPTIWYTLFKFLSRICNIFYKKLLTKKQATKFMLPVFCYINTPKSRLVGMAPSVRESVLLLRLSPSTNISPSLTTSALAWPTWLAMLPRLASVVAGITTLTPL